MILSRINGAPSPTLTHILLCSTAEDKPIDIWNLEKKEKEVSTEKNNSNLVTKLEVIENKVYKKVEDKFIK